MSDHITVKDDKPTVIYRYVPKEPASVVPGVAARDLTAFDLAAYSAEQRLAVHLEAQRDGGAYKKVGTLPRGLSLDPDEGAAPADAEPAAKPGKKE